MVHVLFASVLCEHYFPPTCRNSTFFLRCTLLIVSLATIRATKTSPLARRSAALLTLRLRHTLSSWSPSRHARRKQRSGRGAWFPQARGRPFRLRLFASSRPGASDGCAAAAFLRRRREGRTRRSGRRASDGDGDAATAFPRRRREGRTLRGRGPRARARRTATATATATRRRPADSDCDASARRRREGRTPCGRGPRAEACRTATATRAALGPGCVGRRRRWQLAEGTHGTPARRQSA